MGEQTRTVVITGASGGLGQAMTEAFASRGFDVLLNYHQDRGGAAAAAAAARLKQREEERAVGERAAAERLETERKERARLEHRLISLIPIDATFSAGEYAELAHAEIDALLEQGGRPIVVGGTGLYLRAALTELQLRPPPPSEVRGRWIRELERLGSPALHAVLAQRAPWAAGQIEPADRQRVVRALELLDIG